MSNVRHLSRWESYILNANLNILSAPTTLAIAYMGALMNTNKKRPLVRILFGIRVFHSGCSEPDLNYILYNIILYLSVDRSAS